jgi:transcriptional regulator with XRE-family HTH domain
LRELAKRVSGVTAAHLSDIEFGRRHPSSELLARLAHVFNIDIEELRELDPRAPVEDIKRLAQNDPQFGFAFRQLVDEAVEKRLTPDDIIKFVRRRQDKQKSK